MAAVDTDVPVPDATTLNDGSTRIVNPTDNPQSKFFIHPNESVGNRVIAKTFDGTNYVAWAKSVHLSLKVKGKFGFLDGSISVPTPDNPVLYEAWEKVNALILS